MGFFQIFTSLRDIKNQNYLETMPKHKIFSLKKFILNLLLLIDFFKKLTTKTIYIKLKIKNKFVIVTINKKNF